MTPLLHERIGRLVYGLTEYTVPTGVNTYALVSFTHDECALSTFCRNPLHPGPCKGWKRRLGLVAPGALHSLERAAVEKREARRKARVEALVKAGQPVPKRLQKPITYDPAKNKHLQGPPDLTKDQAKQAIATVPTANDLRKKVDNRRQAAAVAAVRPEAKKAADFSAQLLGFLGVDPAKLAQAKDQLALQYERMHAAGDDAGFQKNAEMLAERVMRQVEKNSNDKFHGLGAYVREELTKEIKQALEGKSGATPVLNEVPNGSVDDLLRVTRDQRAAALKAKKSASAAKAAATRKANAAKKAAPSAPAAGGMAKLTDQQLVNGVKMHGSTTGQGKDAAEELKRRGLDLDGNPIAKPASSPPSAPAKAAAPSAAPNTPAPSSAPTAAAPLPSSASAAAKHAQAVASRSAPGARLGKTHANAYGKLTKDDFDALPDATKKTILDDLNKAHDKFLDQKKKDDVKATLDRLTGKPSASATSTPAVPAQAAAPAAPSAPAAPAYSPRSTAGQLAALRDEKDPHEILKRWTLLHFRDRNDPDTEKEREATRKHFESDTSQPLWLRGTMAAADPKFDRQQHKGAAAAIGAATDPPSQSGTYYPTTHNLDGLMSLTKKEQDALPPVLREAVNDRREEAVTRLLGHASGATFDTKGRALEAVFATPEPWRKGLDKGRLELLSPSAETQVKGAVNERVAALANNNRYEHASNWQLVLDDLTGKKLDPKAANALAKLKQPGLSGNQHLDALEAVDHDIWMGLDDIHQRYLSQRLTQLHVSYANNPDVTRRIRHILAEHMGWNVNRKRYSTSQMDAAHAATTDVDYDEAIDRVLAYSTLTRNEFEGMHPDDRKAVSGDLKKIADDKNERGPLRYRAQAFRDNLDPRSNGMSLDQTDAAKAASLSARSSGSSNAVPWADRADAYEKLNKASFDALPSAYRDAIMTDLDDSIRHADATRYDKIKSTFDPTYAASKATPAVTVPSGPISANVKDALDIVYGIDPKAKTAPRQLSVYSKLRKSEFDQLQSQEQSTILGDLAYIAGNSKSVATQNRAKDAIHKLSPPGTPWGTIPNQPINVPSNAVSGQTRVADPNGVAGTLKKAANPGKSGDGWFTSTNGRRVWGKYGAAGLLLRHVDPATGEERFLMVQRGPGISDPGKWQFPGGAIDSQETFHEGAAREVIEELGFKDNDLLAARVHGDHTSSIPGGWSYVSIAATVDKQLVPDLSTHHARMETADAKWMTAAEIKALDKQNVLLKPLAGGQLETNVMSLFPSKAPTGSAPITPGKRPPRLTGTPALPTPKLPYKPSRAKNLVPDQAAQDKLRADIAAVRKNYRGKVADERLAAIADMQGYTEPATVMSKADMDALLATGDYIEAWRGVSGRHGSKSAADINEDMRSGVAYYGLGVFGNGYYFATDKAIAKSYSDGTKGSLARVLIPKAAAKIGKHDDIKRDAAKTTSSARYVQQGGRQSMGGGTLHDEGRYATAAGFDGIEVSASTYRRLGGHGYLAKGPVYVWLNRSMLIIEEH